MDEEVFAEFTTYLKRIVPVPIDTQNSLVSPEAKPTIYVGIDPGTTGAIAFLHGKEDIFVVDIPVFRSAVTRQKAPTKKDKAELKKRGVVKDDLPKTVSKKGSKAEFDLYAIVKLFNLLDSSGVQVVVSLEKVPPKVVPGPFRYGDVILYSTWAMWPLFVASRGYTLIEPRPAEWQAAFGLRGGAKEQSRAKAQKTFPRSTHFFSRKKDHNRAEALFIALYGKKQRDLL